MSLKELEYPFNAEEIIKKKKKYKRLLLEDETKNFVEKKVAILGGQTTEAIKQVLELFLLNYGIRPQFYESEYNLWYEDGMFDNPELLEFQPDIIYVCTCIRNITTFPHINDSAEEIQEKKQAILQKFEGFWNHLLDVYHCTVIQNDFEYPYYRLMGNRDAYDMHGKVNFVSEVNAGFYKYAREHENFHVCNVNYISASYGLTKWADPYYWHMYKYAVAVPAIPYLSYNVANIIKSVYGKNKKALNLDLDNTLWGGVIGDDGAENIEIGQETSVGQSYDEFQRYVKEQKELGVLLTVNSKNDEKNAISGFERSDSVLKMDDFVSFKANWNPKSINLEETATELNLLPESFVFVDDNPAERAIVEGQLPGVATPSIDAVEHYIETIDKSGYFEVTTFSEDDKKRNKMYAENAKRKKLEASFSNYDEYLASLEMKAEIKSFVPEYMSRIAQLTNKSNQFNLTTKRYAQSVIEEVAADSAYITLYGKLEDKFGDNGVVSILIGKIDEEHPEELHMDLWLMSCRVLKRNMEFAMMDVLVKTAKEHGIKKIVGYYYPTAKNAMVRDFYGLQGFEKVNEDEAGNTKWEYVIPEDYENKQSAIEIL